jgi:hypothetical protein
MFKKAEYIKKLCTIFEAKSLEIIRTWEISNEDGIIRTVHSSASKLT